MDRSFDFILAGAAVIVGIMLLTGHGDIFLKGGNVKLRNEKYDEKKMSLGSGVALLLIGIVTFIDSYTTSLASKIAYIIIILLIIAGLALYTKYKCVKKK